MKFYVIFHIEYKEYLNKNEIKNKRKGYKKMEKEKKLSEAEEKQIKILKMRMIRDNREKEIDEYNENKEENEKLDIKVEDVEFLGQIKFQKDIDGEKKDFEFDIYRETEIKDDKTIQRYCEENDNLLGMKDPDFGLMASEQYKEIEEELVEKIQELEEKERDKGEEQKKNKKLSLKEEENNLAKEILNKSKQNEKEKTEEKEKESKEEIPEEELKKVVPSIQEVSLNQVIDDRGTKLGNRLNLGGEYTKLTVARTEQVGDITKEGKSTEFTILAYNSATGNLEQVQGLEMDGASGNNPTNESIKVDRDGDVDKDNKTKSRFIFKNTNTTLEVENGSAGEIEVYLGKKAENSNEYISTQLETNQVWPTSHEVRALQSDRDGKYRTDAKTEEAEEHEEHGHEVKNIKDVDGKRNTISEECKENIEEKEEEMKQKGEDFRYTDEDVKQLSELLKVSDNEARRLFDAYLEVNSDVKKIDEQAINEIEEEENGDFTNPRGR